MESFISTLNMVWKIVFIAFFFGFCIFIHEFGHLLAALWQKLHVEKFSLGFGTKLWGFTKNGVEYIISLLPFGGYVSLPQLDPTDTPVTSDNTPLPAASPKARAITAFAGPFFNVLFGFVLATIMWIAGVWEAPQSTSCVITAIPQTLPEYKNGLKITDTILEFDGKPTEKFLEELCETWNPEEGTKVLKVERTDGSIDQISLEPAPNPEWVAGLRKGDRIIAVNGKKFTQGHSEFVQEYVYSKSENITLTIVRDGIPQEITYAPLPNPLMEGLGYPFFTAQNACIISSIQPDSPAASQSLSPNGPLAVGDQILQLNKTNILNATHLQKELECLQGTPFTLTCVRNGKEFTTREISCTAPASLNSLGIGFSVLISNLLKDKPGYQAGLRQNDKIIAVNGTNILNHTQLTALIRASEGKPLSITLVRDGKTITLPPFSAEKISLPNGKEQYMIGAVLSDTAPKIIVHPNPWKQFSRIVTQTRRTLGLLFTPLTSRITGHSHSKATVKVEHMSGPVGIVMMLWYSLKAEGIRGGLSFIILITFSLAIMNLLPIPVLDGGHILFAVIEMIIRRKLPAKFLNIIQNIFAILLIALFLYITFFDGKRLFKLFQFGSTKPQHPKIEQKVPEKTPELQLQKTEK